MKPILAALGVLFLVVFMSALPLWLAGCSAPALPPAPAPSPVAQPPICIDHGASNVCCLACARMAELNCDAFGPRCPLECARGGWGEQASRAVFLGELEDAVSRSIADRIEVKEGLRVTWFGLFACTNWRR